MYITSSLKFTNSMVFSTLADYISYLDRYLCLKYGYYQNFKFRASETHKFGRRMMYTTSLQCNSSIHDVAFRRRFFKYNTMYQQIRTLT